MTATRLDNHTRQIREQAIARHHALAAYFEGQYRRLEQDYHASSFTYGRHKLHALLDEVLTAVPAGSRVLDVGCGTGVQIKRCRELGLGVVGVEPAANMREAARRLNPDVPILEAVITDLPFSDQEFDLVLAIEVLRYLHRKEVERAYREMWRMLKPGGRLLFTMVSPFALTGFYGYDALRRLLRAVIGGDQPVHCEFVTPSRLRKDMKVLGADSVSLYGRVCVPFTLAFRVTPALGASAARSLERVDDFLSRQRWMVPFADQVVVVAGRGAP